MMDIPQTGIVTIDEEHAWILNSIRSLCTVVQGSGDGAANRKLMGVVLDAVVTHCKHEEEIAIELGMAPDALSTLREAHQALNAYLGGTMDVLKGSQDVECDLVTKLEGRIHDHIASVDVPLLAKLTHRG